MREKVKRYKKYLILIFILFLIFFAVIKLVDLSIYKYYGTIEAITDKQLKGKVFESLENNDFFIKIFYAGENSHLLVSADLKKVYLPSSVWYEFQMGNYLFLINKKGLSNIDLTYTIKFDKQVPVISGENVILKVPLFQGDILFSFHLKLDEMKKIDESVFLSLDYLNYYRAKIYYMINNIEKGDVCANLITNIYDKENLQDLRNRVIQKLEKAE